MRRDLIIGFVITIALEVLVGWGGDLTHFKPKPVVKDDEPKIEISMPKIEPDEPDVVEDQPQTPQDIAPPMQNDMPQAITPESFVQQIEPPPPDVSALAKNIVKIPETRSGLSGMEVFDVSKLDQAPIAKLKAAPQYPFEMRRAGITGEVLLQFIVDVNGDVRNVSAVRSDHREFEAAAIQAVAKWKFRPGRKNGHAVNSLMQLPLEFTLNKDDN
jgi:protein TonB